MKADMSSGTASVVVAVIGLISVVTSTLLDDYLKRREREQEKK
jgi:hypothetical protein